MMRNAKYSIVMESRSVVAWRNFRSSGGAVRVNRSQRVTFGGNGYAYHLDYGCIHMSELIKLYSSIMCSLLYINFIPVKLFLK